MGNESRHPHVVIVGGGFGGLTLARRLKKAPVRVTLVDKENHHLFQPLLYQVATAALSPDQIATPIRSVLRRQRNVRVLLDEACGADFERRELTLGSGESLSYDYLVIAAGSRTTFLGNERYERHARGLKSLRDALAIRQEILLAFERASREPDVSARREMLNFVVVGGGPLGVEMAGAISELGRQVLARDYSRVSPEDVSVVLLEMGERVLPGFDPELSDKAAQQLRSIGVEVHTSTRVDDVHSDGVLTNKGPFPAALVCWAPGVEAVELSMQLDVETAPDGRIAVNADCSLPNHPEVFAVGDIASFVPEGQEQPLPALAPVAMQQARFVADAVSADLRGRARGVFRYRDKGLLATVGRSRAVAQVGGAHLSGVTAWLAWLAVHLYFLIGFRNRALVMFDWMWSYAAFRRGARVMMGEPRQTARSKGEVRRQRAARIAHGRGA